MLIRHPAWGYGLVVSSWSAAMIVLDENRVSGDDEFSWG